MQMFTPLAHRNIKGSSAPVALTGTFTAAFGCVKDGADGGGSMAHGDKLRAANKITLMCAMDGVGAGYYFDHIGSIKSLLVY